MGCARLVYNRALAARTQAWYERKERIGYVESSAMLTLWKKKEELSFLNEVSCVPLQQGLRHLQSAFSNFFAGRAKYPNFKKKHNGGSAEYTKSAFNFSAAPTGHKGGQIFLAKCKERPYL
jgi:putative transposase